MPPSRADHDRVVRFIAATRFPFSGQADWPVDTVTITNETERRRGIDTAAGKDDIREVETEIGEAQASIWTIGSAAADSKTKTGVKHFFVYVPAGLEQKALDLLGAKQISHAGVRGYLIDAAGKIRIVPFVTTGDPKDHVESVST